MSKIGKTRAFLTEFLIVILFFSISAVITIQLYVKSDAKSKESMAVNKAGIYVQNMAEHIKAKDSEFINEGEYTVCLDKDFCETDKDTTYVCSVNVSVKDKEQWGDTMEYSIKVTDNTYEKVYSSINFCVYTPKEGQ